MSIPELIASGSPDSDSPLLQALNTAEQEIITLREQRDELVSVCKAAMQSLGALKPAGPLIDTYMAIEKAVKEVEGKNAKP